MTHFPILLTATIFLALSCNNPSTTGNKSDNTESTDQCYRYSSAGDTVKLTLVHNGDAVTGTLTYQFREKDRNTGTIQGRMQGDILLADYTFMSEGVSSVREVAFKLVDGYMVDGYGELMVTPEKVKFRDVSALKFEGIIRLPPVDCE